MNITILDLFKIWETLENSRPLTEAMSKAKEHLEAHLSTIILDLKLTKNPGA